MNDNSFFSLIDSYSQFRHELIERLGELSDELEANLLKLESQIIEKTDNLARWDLYLKSESERIILDIETLNDHLAKITKARTRYHHYVNACMIKLDQNCIEGESYFIKRRKPSEIVVIDDIDKLPFDYISRTEIVEIKADKNKLKQDLKKNIKIDGAHLGLGKVTISFERK